MKIKILSIGKFKKNDFNQQIFFQYKKRLPWKIDLKELEIKENFDGEILKEKEADLIISNLGSNNKIIVLDERGKNISSAEFAKQIITFTNNGFSDFTFIIGGAGGLSERIRQKADLVLSLSQMTFPHLMVRNLLIEQLYRCYCIVNNHPYHK